MTASDWGPDSPAQGGPVPADAVVQGATNTPNPDPSAIPSGNDGSGDLEPQAFDPLQPADPVWREVTRNVALGHAAKVITSGYRLVSDDEATVERVAAKIWGSGVLSGWSLDMEHYRVMARAAVRALLGEDRDA